MPNGFDLEQVLTLIRNDISLIKGDVSDIKGDVSDIKTKIDILIDSAADTTTRIVQLERTQHEH